MDSSNKQGDQKKSAKKVSTKRIIIICIALAIIVALLTIFVVIPALRTDFFDPRAQSGPLPGTTQEDLDKIVEEGMFNISIATVIIVKKGSDEALVLIENIPANHHNMKVTITLDKGNEVIYESAGLAPGQYIEYGKLNRKLPVGEYKATALFTAYDTEDLSSVGQAAAKVTIVVGK